MNYNYKNFGYITGQGEGLIGVSSRLEKLKGFLVLKPSPTSRDISGQDESGQALPEEQVIAKFRERGQQKLSEFAEEFFLEGQALTNLLFKYGIDYDLGNIVTIQNREWGVTRDARITEIKEIYKPGGFQIKVTFGESRPTLVKKLKQELSQISREVRK